MTSVSAIYVYRIALSAMINMILIIDCKAHTIVYVLRPPLVLRPATFAVIQNPLSLTCAPISDPEKAARATRIAGMPIVGTAGATMPTAVIMATVPEP